MCLVNLVNIFTEYVSIYLGDDGVNLLYMFLPESSYARWDKSIQLIIFKNIEML